MKISLLKELLGGLEIEGDTSLEAPEHVQTNRGRVNDDKDSVV